MRQPKQSRSGQALLMVTLSLTVLFGMLGLAVDVGWAYYRQQAAQAAADAAAQAAVLAAGKAAPTGLGCGSPAAVWCEGPTNCPSTAPTTATSSFDNACMLAAANGFTTSGNDTVSVQAGTNSTIPTVAGPTAAYWAIVRVKETSPLFFAAAFTSTSLTPGAVSTAMATAKAGSGSCIYVLDPTASDAFVASTSAQVKVDCGIYVNSNARSPNEAMLVTTSATVTSSNIQVVGRTVTNTGGSTSSSPKTLSAPVADPFASLPSPAPSGSCATANYATMSSYTVSPGTYCTFSVSTSANVTMNPGVYIINGGSFNISTSATLTSNGGVTIYLTGGASMSISTSAVVTLAAPTSGPYAGVVVYEDRTMANPAPVSFSTLANVNLTGSVYLPHGELDISTAMGSNTMAIVADKVNFSTDAHILADNDGSKTGLGGGYTYSVVQ